MCKLFMISGQLFLFLKPSLIMKSEMWVLFWRYDDDHVNVSIMQVGGLPYIIIAMLHVNSGLSCGSHKSVTFMKYYILNGWHVCNFLAACLYL